MFEQFVASRAQQGIWLAQNLNAELINHPAMVWELSGPVEADLLGRAITAVLAEDAVRVSYREVDGVLTQTVGETGAAVPFRLDVSGAEDPDRAAVVELAGVIAAPFDLERDVLFRIGTVRLAELRHLLVVVFHHIASDGYGSIVVLTRRIAELYRAWSAGEPAPAPTWASADSVVRADMQYRESERFDADARFFASYLADAPDPVRLARTGSGPARLCHGPGVERDGAADRWAELASATGMVSRSVTVGHAEAKAWYDVADAINVSFSTLITTAAAHYFARRCAQDEVLFSMNVRDRRTDLARHPGLATNLVPLRVPAPRDATLGGSAPQVAQRMREAFAHSAHHVGDIIAGARAGGATRNPFGVLLNVMPFVETLELGAARGRLRLGSWGATDELAITIFGEAGRDGDLHVRLDSPADLYDEAELGALARDLVGFLAARVRHPEIAASAVEPVSDTDEDVLAVLRGAAPGTPQADLTTLLAHRVQNDPHAVALRAGNTKLTYRELVARAEEVAGRLLSRGVGPGDRVAVVLPRSADLVVGFLGVLRAGAAYVPLDPAYPLERIRAVVEDAQPACALTTDRFAGLVRDTGVPLVPIEPGAGVVTAPQPLPARPDAAAYVMFTSGSTGRPKGIEVTHRNVVDFARDRAWARGHDRVLLRSPHTFDASTYELWVPLLHGGTVVVAPEGDLGPGELSTLLDSAELDSICVPPALFALLADQEPRCFANLSHVVIGGDRASAAAIRQASQVCPDTRFVNVYGPTETTVIVTRHEFCDPQPGDEGIARAGLGDAETGDDVPIGRATDGTRLLVLDSALHQVPPGRPGDLYVSGTGVARGYVGRAAATAQRFLPCPGGEPGSRMYRTGDVVAVTNGGELVFLGRSDDQVKIRGFRVEPGEVESVLGSHHRVASAAVLVRDEPGAGTDKQLVGYVVLDGTTVGEVREFLAQRLPGFLVPARIMALAKMPLNVHGKIDRAALPSPDPAGVSARAPRSDIEIVLTRLFAELTGATWAGIDDNFFLLGGHSLLAARLINTARDELGCELTIGDVFAAPTVAQLAERVEADPRRDGPRRRDRPEIVPLSFAQARLWFLHRFGTPSATYNIPVVLRAGAGLDPDALGRAFDDVLGRHEVLRTTIAEGAEGVAHQRIHPAGSIPTPLRVVDAAAADVEALVAEAANEIFDLERVPPVRATLLRIDGVASVLILVLHHIAGDGESVRPLGRDLSRAYAARLAGHGPEWDELELQYADFASWQRDTVSSADGRIESQLRYWTDELGGLTDPVEVVTDHPRPVEPSGRGARVSFTISPEVTDRITTLARARHVTPAIVVQAALAVLVGQTGAGDEVRIGSPIAGRTDAAVADLVGFFVNTWVLRTPIRPAWTFAEVVDRVATKAVAAYENQDAPFDRVVELVNPERSGSHSTLFQVLYAWEEPLPSSELGGAEVEWDLVPTPTSKFDLVVNVGPERAGTGLRGTVEYDLDLFESASVRAWADRLVRTLESLVTDPDRCVGATKLVDAAESAALVGPPAAPEPCLVPPYDVVSLVTAVAAAAPDSVAVSATDTELTYARLDRDSAALAGVLRSRGAAPGEVVAVAVPRSADLAVAVLGVLRTGADVLAVDDGDPRVAGLLERTGVRLEITAPDVPVHLGVCRIGVDGSGPGEEPAGDDNGTDAAQPGSILVAVSSPIGPVAVPLCHGVLSAWAAEATRLGAGAPGSGVWTLSHGCDSSVWPWELLGALSRGDRAVVVPDAVLGAPDALWDLAICEAITMFLVSSAVTGTPEQITHSAGPAQSRATWPVVVPVEELPGDDPGARGLLAMPEAPDPVANGTVRRVLGPGLQLLPPGAVGELYLAGPAVAAGFRALPAVSARRFVADPHGRPGSRMYRSGLLARVRPDRGPEVVGRTDGPCATLGRRFHPGEVQAALLACPGVADALVVADRDGAGTPVAWVVPSRSDTSGARTVSEVDVDLTAGVTPAELRRLLRRRLPAHLVPEWIGLVEALPRRRSDGSVAATTGSAQGPAGDEPASPDESMLAAIVADVVGAERVGRDEDFFALGGGEHPVDPGLGACPRRRHRDQSAAGVRAPHRRRDGRRGEVGR